MPELRRMRPLLGTFVEITVSDSSAPAPAAAIDAAFSVIEKVQSLMSFHDPCSELSKLNREAHHKPVAVHPWTRRVLQICGRLHATSKGVFDPSVAAQLVHEGVLPRPAGELGQAEPDPAASFSDVRITDAGVEYLRPLWLDLGGIAKGFAVDAAIAAMRAKGVRQAHINAGGDLRVIGHAPIPVYLRDPDEPAATVPVGMLRNAACATSGNYFSDRGGAWNIVSLQRMHQPQAKSVTVLARRCVLADALTKVVALTGLAAARPVLEHFHASAFTGLPS